MWKHLHGDWNQIHVTHTNTKPCYHIHQCENLFSIFSASHKWHNNTVKCEICNRCSDDKSSKHLSNVGNFYQTTWCNTPEDNHLHTFCHEISASFMFQEGTIGHDLVVKPVPASVRQHLDQPRDSKRGDDDEMFLDENGEDIQEDVAIETGFPLRRIQSTSNSEPKPQQHIIYRRSSSQFEEPEFSDYGNIPKSNTTYFYLPFSIKSRMQKHTC